MTSGMDLLLTSYKRPNDLNTRREGRRNEGQLRRRRYTCGISALVVVTEVIEESIGIGSMSITLSRTYSHGYTTLKRSITGKTSNSLWITPVLMPPSSQKRS